VTLMKYQEGTKLVCKKGNNAGDDRTWKGGEVITIVYSTQYPGAYRIKGQRDVGWIANYIEDETRFRPASLKEIMKDVI